MKKKVCLLLLLGTLLCLSACTAEKSAAWDPRFLSSLQPTDDILVQSDSWLQEVKQQVDYPDVSINLLQTLACEDALYLAVDFHFPSALPPTALDAVSLRDLAFYTKEANTAPYRLNGTQMTEVSSINEKDKIVSYLIYFAPLDYKLAGKTLTMRLSGFWEDAPEASTDGYALSWTVAQYGPCFSKTFEVVDVSGAFSLSPFHLRLTLSDSPFDSYAALSERLGLLLKDGSVYPLPLAYSSGDLDAEGRGSLSFRFETPLDLRDAVGLALGEERLLWD